MGFGTVPAELQNAFSDIQDKYNDIKKLERSVQEVYQMFQDMSNLVFIQGEMLNSIEGNLNSAKDYVAKAQVNLTEAKDLHGAARKKMCCLICFVIFVIVVVFGGYKMII